MTPIFVFTGIVKSTPVPLLMCVTTTPILFTSPTVSTVTGFFAFHMIPNMKAYLTSSSLLVLLSETATVPATALATATAQTTVPKWSPADGNPDEYVRGKENNYPALRNAHTRHDKYIQNLCHFLGDYFSAYFLKNCHCFYFLIFRFSTDWSCCACFDVCLLHCFQIDQISETRCFASDDTQRKMFYRI